MTKGLSYVIKCWDRQRETYVLKAFEEDCPVYITDRRFNKGLDDVLVFPTISKAYLATDKVKRSSRQWRHIAIVRLI